MRPIYGLTTDTPGTMAERFEHRSQVAMMDVGLGMGKGILSGAVPPIPWTQRWREPIQSAFGNKPSKYYIKGTTPRVFPGEYGRPKGMAQRLGYTATYPITRGARAMAWPTMNLSLQAGAIGLGLGAGIAFGAGRSALRMGAGVARLGMRVGGSASGLLSPAGMVGAGAAIGIGAGLVSGIMEAEARQWPVEDLTRGRSEADQYFMNSTYGLTQALAQR